MLTFENAALLVTDAHAEGGGLGEQDAGQSLGLGGCGKHGEDDAGTAFLHLHRNAKGIQGSGREQLLLHVGEKLGIHVVEIGFEDGDGVFRFPRYRR